MLFMLFYVFITVISLSSWRQNGHFTLKMGFNIHDGFILQLI